jgi:hypothetical protein
MHKIALIGNVRLITDTQTTTTKKKKKKKKKWIDIQMIISTILLSNIGF